MWFSSGVMVGRLKVFIPSAAVEVIPVVGLGFVDWIKVRGVREGFHRRDPWGSNRTSQESVVVEGGVERVGLDVISSAAKIAKASDGIADQKLPDQILPWSGEGWEVSGGKTHSVVLCLRCRSLVGRQVFR
jgi:hypothetical protein